MESVSTFSDLIDQLGGVRVLSAEWGKSVNTVAGMKRRNSISPKHWPDVLRIAEGKGLHLSADALVEMARREKVQ